MNFAKSLCIAILLFVILGADLAFAGFGVTPPYVRNTSLTRNSTYEQQILLVRGDPDVELSVNVLVAESSSTAETDARQSSAK